MHSYFAAQPKCSYSKEFVPPRTQKTRFSTCYIAIFSRKVVHSIAQICYTFQGICASRTSKYYISSNLCTRELKAQNFQASYAFKSSKCHMEVCASRSSNTTFSKGAYAFESPKCSKESVPPRAHATTFLGSLCLQALAEPTPLLATLPDHWLHSCRSRWPNFETPYSQNLAVKECCFVPRGVCGGFFMKFLVATFMEIKG